MFPGVHEKWMKPIPLKRNVRVSHVIKVMHSWKQYCNTLANTVYRNCAKWFIRLHPANSGMEFLCYFLRNIRNETPAMREKCYFEILHYILDILLSETRTIVKHICKTLYNYYKTVIGGIDDQIKLMINSGFEINVFKLRSTSLNI